MTTGWAERRERSESESVEAMAASGKKKERKGRGETRLLRRPGQAHNTKMAHETPDTDTGSLRYATRDRL